MKVKHKNDPHLVDVAPQTTLQELVVQIKQSASEDGWNGVEHPADIKQIARSTLQLLEQETNGKFKRELIPLETRRQETQQRKEGIDAALAMYRAAATDRDLTAPARPLIWAPRRMVTMAIAVALCCFIIKQSTPTLPWQALATTVLTGALLFLLPWGLVAAARNAGLKFLDGISYLLNLYRSWRLGRELKKHDTHLHEERQRRAQADRWISQRLDHICANYEMYRRRAACARIVACTIRERRNTYEQPNSGGSLPATPQVHSYFEGNWRTDRQTETSDQHSNGETRIGPDRDRRTHGGRDEPSALV